MVLWYNMLDVATLNAYTSFITQDPGYMGGVNNADFSLGSWEKSLLAMPYMKRHMEGMPKLQKHIIEAMGRCGLKKPKTQPPPSHKRATDRRGKGGGRGAQS